MRYLAIGSMVGPMLYRVNVSRILWCGSSSSSMGLSCTHVYYGLHTCPNMAHTKYLVIGNMVGSMLYRVNVSHTLLFCGVWQLQ